MFKKLKTAISVPEIRNRLLFMLFGLILIRMGSQLPVPGIQRDAISAWFGEHSGMLGFFDLLSGGSLSSMSVFALSITPYITASIVMELLSVAIPPLKEMAEEGETGRKKKANLTKYLGIVLAAVQAAGTMLTFERQGLLTGSGFLPILGAAVAMTAGTSFLIWFADRLTDHGLGNGTSFILLVNICSGLPAMMRTLVMQFIAGKSFLPAVMAALVIVLVIVVTVVMVIYLEGGERCIPITNAQKISGNRAVSNQGSDIPLKVNMAGVIPVIFAQTLLSIPAMIQAFSGSNNRILASIAAYCSENYWFSTDHPLYTLGFAVHLLLVFLFAYYYTGIIFDPWETAGNLQKRGSTIPGIRPGKPTALYLSRVIKRLVFIGAVGLVLITSIPAICTGLFHASVSFGGTSIIIVAGVILEAARSIESELAVRNYQSIIR